MNNFFNVNQLAATHPGWIIAMVGAFIVWWPLGLLILAYILWSGSLGRVNGQWWARAKSLWPFPGWPLGDSGNRAFEEHRKATLDKLEAEKQKLANEERAFTIYVDKLRTARDRQQFEDFIKQRDAS